MKELEKAIAARDALEQCIARARIDESVKTHLVQAHRYECARIDALLKD